MANGGLESQKVAIAKTMNAIGQPGPKTSWILCGGADLGASGQRGKGWPGWQGVQWSVWGVRCAQGPG